MNKIKRLIMMFMAIMMTFTVININVMAEDIDIGDNLCEKNIEISESEFIYKQAGLGRIEQAKAILNEKYLSKDFGYSKFLLIEELNNLPEAFTEEEANQAISELKVNFFEQAVKRATRLRAGRHTVDESRIIMEYMDYFTREETFHAILIIYETNLTPTPKLDPILEPTPINDLKPLQDTVTVNKEARMIRGCRRYEVTLEIDGYRQYAPVDVVLVIDISGSMNEGASAISRLDGEKMQQKYLQKKFYRLMVFVYP